MIACGSISLTIAVGYDPAGTSTDTGTPSVVGNVAAQAVLTFRHGDGSNQLANLHPQVRTRTTPGTPQSTTPTTSTTPTNGSRCAFQTGAGASWSRSA